MVHATGANNPKLSRYVGPNDGLLGENKYGNHWNRPMDRQVCVHAFIGKLADGSIATYQTLPWNHRGWHSGSGKKGSANNTHIGFEICEDGLTDANYFAKVYKEAVELCAHLCKLYNLTADTIICHAEGYKQGIASNHGDVLHWFPKHGKSMDTFRADVKALLKKEKAPAEVKAVSVKLNVLRKGSTGEQVEAVQRILSSYGYNLGTKNPYDGSFGQMTEDAVNAFKKAHGLPADGTVDADVWAALLGV
jgi:N-acetyl-anhydromuramyl-L-alanine amidase AmpD